MEMPGIGLIIYIASVQQQVRCRQKSKSVVKERYALAM